MSETRVFPKVVDVCYLDQVAERGFETFPACLINETMILRVANGQVEIHPVKETDNPYSYQLADEDGECSQKLR